MKFICLLLINLLNAAFIFLGFFLATEFIQYVGPNSKNSYAIKCQSQMGSCGPLIFGMGVLLSTQVNKVNASSSMAHGTPEFLEIYQLYCSGATQYFNLALFFPLHPLPPMQLLL